MSTTYEVEVKIPIQDEKVIEKTILDAGGHRLNAETQTDMYYDHPCRSFFDTDEAIRLRSREPIDDNHLISSGSTRMELTYKGPKVDKTTKTRLEFTSGISDIDAITAILIHTGFKLVGTIKKHRVFFDISGITVSVDVVDNVGRFVELECIANSEETMQAANAKLLQLVERLGLDPQKMVRESYLELFLNRVT